MTKCQASSSKLDILSSFWSMMSSFAPHNNVDNFRNFLHLFEKEKQVLCARFCLRAPTRVSKHCSSITFSVFGTLLATFWSLFPTLLSLFQPLCCAKLLLPDSFCGRVKTCSSEWAFWELRSWRVQGNPGARNLYFSYFFSYFGLEARNLFCSRPPGSQLLWDPCV